MMVGKKGKNRAIAVTGSLGAGKTYVSKLIEEQFGFVRLDADEIGHRVLTFDQTAREIVAHFGEKVFKKGSIDRKLLGEIVFSNRSKLMALEKIVHPQILAIATNEVTTLLESGLSVVFEAAVLFEAGWNRTFSPILTIVCHREEQIKRIMDRNGLTRDAILNIINLQMSDEKKIELSDFVIDTTSGPLAIKKQLTLVMKKIME